MIHALTEIFYQANEKRGGGSEKRNFYKTDAQIILETL